MPVLPREIAEYNEVSNAGRAQLPDPFFFPGGPVKALAAVLIGFSLSAAAAAETAVQPPAFAVVDGVRLPAAEYEQAVALAVRQKFYHRSPSDEVLAGVRREVADSLVERVLLLKEAKRRGLKPQRASVDAALAAYEARYGASPQWPKVRAEALPKLTARLEEDSLVAQLEAKVRDVAQPDEKTLRAYYQRHPELFTEPEQVRLSVILLKVDPTSPRATWDKAEAEARAILKKLQAGGDFAEIARLKSGDAESAKAGGDMGYVHRGMLPEALHGALDKLAPGALSQPVRLLEGVAVFRLADRREQRLRPFDEVRPRAAELVRRERSDGNWSGLIAELRKRAVIEIDRSRYP
jgi:peptidylprolyl isomerase